MAHLLSLLFALAYTTVTSAVPALRIMPLGDSITEWQCNSESQGGWRNFLGQSLRQKVSFDFVGSQYGCGNHEGHSGWTIAQLAQIAHEVVSAHEPDVLLLQAGTNDLFFNQPGYSGGANVSGCLTRMEGLLNIIFAVNRNARVFLSGVTDINATRCANYSQAPWHPPNCPTNMSAWIAELNSKLPALAAAFQQQGFSVAFHDPNPSCAFVEADYWTWGIHFSESGYQKIAAAWFKALGSLFLSQPVHPGL
jgi:lysophospholipase L1-like esterase